MSVNETRIAPVAMLPVKRDDPKIQTNWNLCIFCQVESGNLSIGSKDGIDRVKESHKKRIAYNDVNNWELVKRLEADIANLEKHSPKWHRESCYASFCSKGNIDRVKKRYENSETYAIPTTSSSNVVMDISETNYYAPATRGRISAVNLALCIFCQQRKKKGLSKLSQVRTKNAEENIRQIAKHDEVVRCRTAGLDLIASEVKYHGVCYANMLSVYPSVDRSTSSTDGSFFQDAMHTLVDELDIGFMAGHVYTLDQVTEHYRELVSAHQGFHCSYSTQKMKARLQSYYGDKIDFVQPLQRSNSMLIFPNVPVSVAIQALKLETDKFNVKSMEKELIVNEGLSEEPILNQAIMLVSTKIRADLKSKLGHNSYENIDITHAKETIPNSLYILLKMVISGTTSVYEDSSVSSEQDGADSEEIKILSILQDIVSAASKGKKRTPKQIGLGLAVHQATRSKYLIQLLHASGHCISYDQVQRIHTSIAQNQLNKFIDNDNVFIPDRFVHGRFVQFAADNLDILEETLDAKDTCHVTQIVAFQRGPAEKQNIDCSEIIGQARTLKDITDKLNKLQPSNYSKAYRVVPTFPDKVDADYVLQCDEINSDLPHALDTVWLLSRSFNSETEQQIPSWRGFNQVISKINADITTIGYLPIIPAPASDYDTVWSTICRCQKIALKLGIKNTVLTLDEALYCKAKELMWKRPEECNGLILRLGSFHVGMNFLKAIGQHFQNSGLTDVWSESGVYNEPTAEKLLEGKHWNRAFRIHTLTYEALWRIHWIKFQEWIQESDSHIDPKIDNLCANIVQLFHNKDFIAIQEIVHSDFVTEARILRNLIKDFEDTLTSPTSKFWLQYLDMVQILLDFIRAEREGIWSLHLSSFCKMIPWMMIYDHTNYSRYGLVYLSEMKQLRITAPEVYAEFEAGNFVVKSSNARFNQIPIDQALEHVNKKGKISGGLIGITRIESARDEWCLTYNVRSRLSQDTRVMLGLDEIVDLDEPPHVERGMKRMQRDELDVTYIKNTFESFGVFSQAPHLLKISTKDVVPTEITEALLGAFNNGREAAETFIEERMQPSSKVLFFNKLTKHNSKSFATLKKLTATVQTKHKLVVSDATLLRRLLVAADSGRDIDLHNILQYELHDVPLSLATYERRLRIPTNKAMLSDILIGNCAVPTLPVTEHTSPTCLIIDAMSLVQALGKPPGIVNFGELADIFAKLIFKNFSASIRRIDVVFDSYKMYSIKSATRSHRTAKHTTLIRRIIQDRNVPLPNQWSGFINLIHNKKSLTDFLSTQLMELGAKMLRPDQCLVTTGGYNQIDHATSTSGFVSNSLFADHEEADTRLILHAKDASDAGYKNIIVQCKDTDVLVLLVHMFEKINASELWMSTGTSANKAYVPIHTVYAKISTDVRNSLLGFHSISGCDTTSQPSGYGKKTAWETYVKNPSLLSEIGVDELSENAIKSAEIFFINMYSRSLPSIEAPESIDELRVALFSKSSPEKLPPTFDAFKLHVQRAHYQALVWRKALEPKPFLPDVRSFGWYEDANGDLMPKLMDKEPFPQSYKQLLQCGCKTNCSRSTCKCAANGIPCMTSCSCLLELCQNTVTQNQNDLHVGIL